MRRFIFGVMFVFVVLVAQSATIVWDSLGVWNASQCYLESDLGYPRSLSLGLAKTSLGNDTYSYQANMVNLMFFGNWTQAYAGDIVSELSFSNDNRDIVYTENCQDSLVVSFGSSAVADAHEGLYLAFKCGYEDAKMEIAEPIYGWISFDVSPDGSLVYAHSAWDLDGGAMIVGGGAAPEPTAAMLLLLGVAGLALRRKREYGETIE